MGGVPLLSGLGQATRREYGKIDETTAVWSGVATDEKALIRTVSFGPELKKSIEVFGHQVELPFERGGRFFWVYPDGRISPLAQPEL